MRKNSPVFVAEDPHRRWQRRPRLQGCGRVGRAGCDLVPCVGSERNDNNYRLRAPSNAPRNEGVWEGDLTVLSNLRL
jgi:hypothetical protein